MDIFPRSRQALIAPVIGLVATLAPTVGPTVGGYLTDALSWHWLFFINIIPGIVVTVSVLALVDFDQPDFGLFRSFDAWGLLFMAVFLGALEYVLEEGPQYDWLDDSTVAFFAVVSGVSAVAFFARVLTAKTPIVDLRSFSDRNFAVGSLFSFVLGIGLYGLTYLYPVYLARVRGYDALTIGDTMFVSGLAMFLTAPIAGQLSVRLDPRLVLAAGFITFAFGAWWMNALTGDWDFNELLWPQIFRGVGLMLAIVPITNVALGTLSPDRLKNASGLFNLMRNLGGAIGLAAINTALNDQMDLHLARLHEAVNTASRPALETITQLTQHFAEFGSDARLMAIKQVTGLVRRQALVMAFADVVLFVGLTLLAVFMQRPAPVAAGAGGH